jgi:hypothetical protein
MKDLVTKNLNEARQAAKRFKYTNSPDDRTRFYHHLTEVFVAMEEEFKSLVRFEACIFTGREESLGTDRESTSPKQNS